VSLTFAELPLRKETIDALHLNGFVAPFAIQEMVLPIALSDGDVIGQAKTGTGKTLAFGIPLIERVIAPKDAEWQAFAHKGLPQALVVVPTRELCVQVARDIDQLAKARGIRVLAVYGGRAFEPQIEQLQVGVEIVVGTPGRLLDLYRQGKLKLSKVARLVLDEADEMLDLGFLPDVEKIFTSTPIREQTMLFSATMPGDIIALARRFMSQPVHIRTQENNDESAVVSRVQQHVLRAHALDKIEMLARILQADGRGPTMVFCRTKRTCQKTADDLLERGFKAAAIHGDLGQSAREKALSDFKAGKSLWQPMLLLEESILKELPTSSTTNAQKMTRPTFTELVVRLERVRMASESHLLTGMTCRVGASSTSPSNSVLMSQLRRTHPLSTYSRL
jgi:superfamily II DNA/RNA helicase